MIPPPPLLAVLSGPSAVGKDAVVRRIIERGLPIHIAVTATTRPPRPGERDGADYFFVSDDEFDRLVRDDALLEWARVYGRRYGVPRAPIRDALAQGRSVLVKTDVQGAATIRRKIPETVLIFLAPPSTHALEVRMRARGDKDEADIGRRLATARTELDQAGSFDFLIVNDDHELDAAVDRVHAVLLAESCRVGRKPPTV